MEMNNQNIPDTNPVDQGLSGTDAFPEGSPYAQQAEVVHSSQRKLRKKSAMLLVTTILVIIVLIALAIAWYTRVANTYAVTFDVADYDLAVNENVDDEYLLNLYDYSAVKNDKMAPGTVGWFPLDISAYHSEVNVTYQIALDSKMPEDVRKHMRFYVLADKNAGNTATATVTKPANGPTAASTEKKSFVYENAPSMVQNISNYEKVYLDQGVVISDDVKITDQGKSKRLCIYWEWYLNVDAAETDNAPNIEEADKTNWDALDTDIGRYPDKYHDAFTVYIKTSGTQVQPADGTNKRKN